MTFDFIEQNAADYRERVSGPSPKAACKPGHVEDPFTARVSDVYLARMAACIARGGVFDIGQEWDNAIRQVEAESRPAVQRTAPGMAQWFELFPPAEASHV